MFAFIKGNPWQGTNRELLDQIIELPADLLTRFPQGNCRLLVEEKVVFRPAGRVYSTGEIGQVMGEILLSTLDQWGREEQILEEHGREIPGHFTFKRTMTWSVNPETGHETGFLALKPNSLSQEPTGVVYRHPGDNWHYLPVENALWVDNQLTFAINHYFAGEMRGVLANSIFMAF